MAQAADFFVSYTSTDRAWAEWIAWQLEADGYQVVVQAWDFTPGRDWAHEMQQAAATAERVVLVLSAAYLRSAHGEAEWRVFYAQDPSGERGLMLPVRVGPVELPGLLTTRVYVDLVDQDAAAARATLLTAAKGVRGKPAAEPEFPGRGRRSESATEAPPFPGELPPEGDARVFQAGQDQNIYQNTMPAPAAVIRTLPRGTAAFTGREDELGQLTQGVGEAAEAGRVVAIHAIDGMPGVGKTAFAVHAAHLLADRFPDGQLFLRLHAHTPGQRPVDPADALAALLASIGVAPQAIPPEAEARAGLWCDRLAGKRMLLVLDDAAGHAQVEPLLPEAAGCLVLVTSRRRLAALTDAVPLALDTLPPAQAAALFTRLAARNVSGTEADAVAELVRLCGYLPLAVALLAGRLRHHPAWSVADLATELAMAQDRLAELQAEDVAVAAAFDLSYQDLPDAHQRFFRRIGLHPGTDLDAYAAAALDGISLSAARRHLEALYNDRLVDEPARGRYRMHDLIREYAIHCGQTEDDEESRRAALTRLFDYYLSVAAAALDTLDPAEHHRRPHLPLTANPDAPEMAEPATARAWLDTERPNLVAVCAHATSHAGGQHTIALATTLYRYLDVAGHHSDAVAVHTNARNAARQLGDGAGEARALNNLAVAYLWQGDYGQAAEHLQQARGLFQQVADSSGEADTLTNLGIIDWSLGQLGEAEEHFQQALALFRQIADRPGEAALLDNLGGVYERQGYPRRAADYHRQALTLNRQIGYREGEAAALTNLGLAYRGQGQLPEAIDCHRQALVLYRQIGYPQGEAEALNGLGLAYRQQGQVQQAIDCHQEALALCRDIGQRTGEANALNGLGEALHAAGAAEEARPLHTEALHVAVGIGDRYQQARAHNGIAVTYHTTGELNQARQHWQRALTLFTDFVILDAETVRARLAALDRQAGDGGAE